MQLSDTTPDAIFADVGSLAANELVFEMRYRANPRVLDHRGEWADLLAREMNLSEWRIVDNRIDLYSSDRTRHAFVGYRNAGLHALDVPTRDYFADQADKLIRKLGGFAEFGMPLKVARIGVRSRFASNYPGSFEDLAARFATRYMSIAQAAREVFGSDTTLLDVGAPLNFRDRLGNLNTMGGPMRGAEFARFFTKDDPFPDVGLYFDIDYWKAPNSDMTEREIRSTMLNFARAGWDKAIAIRDLILG